VLIASAARKWYAPDMARLIDRTVEGPEGKEIRERWVEDSLGDGWLVWFRLAWTGVEYIVGELRVFHDPAHEDWVRSFQMAGDDDIPNGLPVFPSPGLTARRLRGIRFEAVRELAREALEASIDSYFDPEGLRKYLEEARLARRQTAAREKGGRWSDADYVTLAAQYVEKVRDGVRAPVAELAAEMNYSPARIRQALKHTRDRGWLTETTRRRPGGVLTDEALAIARREREEQR